MKNRSELSGVRLLSKQEVLDRIGVSYVTLWGWMRDGKFPRSRELGGKVCWLEPEVDQFIVNLPTKRLKGDPEQNGEAAGSDVASAGKQLGKRDNPVSLDDSMSPSPERSPCVALAVRSCTKIKAAHRISSEQPMPNPVGGARSSCLDTDVLTPLPDEVSTGQRGNGAAGR